MRRSDCLLVTYFLSVVIPIGYLRGRHGVISRNKHHNLLQTIPGIGREKAKALYDHYPTLKSLISNWDDAQSNKIVVGKTWIKVEAFLNKKWGNTPTKPEVIRERKKSESIQRTFEWWEEV